MTEFDSFFEITSKEKIRLQCPLCTTYWNIGKKTETPFRWTVNDAINAFISHIETQHTHEDIKTILEGVAVRDYTTITAVQLEASGKMDRVKE